jgi:hypothetical protein
MTSLFSRAASAMGFFAPPREKPKYELDEQRLGRASSRKFAKPGTLSRWLYIRRAPRPVRQHIEVCAAPFLRATPRFEDGTHGRWEHGKIVPRLSK